MGYKRQTDFTGMGLNRFLCIMAIHLVAECTMEAMNFTILQEVSFLLYSTANCSTAANQEKTTTQVTNCYGLASIVVSRPLCVVRHP